MKEYPKDWDRVVALFSDSIKSALARNAHKGDWHDVPIGDLLSKMDEELGELREAVARGNSVEVLLEAADVAVCAMMIMDQHLGSPRPDETRALKTELAASRMK